MTNSNYWYKKFLRTPVSYENLLTYRFKRYEKCLAAESEGGHDEKS